ncbi:MAG TPA: HNH endonuclease signature motif containing protein, partial [Actinomycetes bacterium]|nr:HNH endonuclease signature motif containing protein [Actinomycetes bacterium]
MALLPPILGGAPAQPLDVGRTSRVVQPAQRTALAVRDGGCVFPDCARPLAWCEAHHLWHWVDGGPTDLANLVLLCRAHHWAV